MSHKVSTFFASCPGPKTLDKFVVFIPGVVNSPLRVSATSFPQQSRAVSRISVAGQPIYVPGRSQVPGTWSCIIDESILCDANIQIQLLKNLVVEDFKGRVWQYKLISPMVFITDQVSGVVPMSSCTLKGAWLESVEELQLDWGMPDKPLRWKLTFRYSYIETPKV